MEYNMEYEIIEDCSPYFIRFKFDGLTNIIKYVSDTIETLGNSAYEVPTLYPQNYAGYSHCNFNNDIAENIINMLPMKTSFSFYKNRVAIFDTIPAGGCGIHKDAYRCKISFNIPIEIHDELCVTNWYSNETFINIPVIGIPYTRNVHKDFHSMNQFPAVKKMTALPNEMLLFNTDIFHSWDNTNSPNKRKVLTLRIINDNDLNFDDIRKILF
jgi:hypothetical protein